MNDLTAKFQFHFGTIQRKEAPFENEHPLNISIPLWYDLELYTALQCGKLESISIPLWYDLELFCTRWSKHRKRDFNSTLVRFRVMLIQPIRDGKVNFNSTLVRFRGILTTPFMGWMTLFQFHFGTIQSEYILIKYISPEEFQFHFGTIQSVVHSDMGFDALSFQFHFGTIQSVFSQFISGLSANFNSTLVRFRDDWEVVKMPVIKFQFHFGTIQSNTFVIRLN